MFSLLDLLLYHTLPIKKGQIIEKHDVWSKFQMHYAKWEDIQKATYYTSFLTS